MATRIRHHHCHQLLPPKAALSQLPQRLHVSEQGNRQNQQNQQQNQQGENQQARAQYENPGHHDPTSPNYIKGNPMMPSRFTKMQ